MEPTKWVIVDNGGGDYEVVSKQIAETRGFSTVGSSFDSADAAGIEAQRLRVDYQADRQHHGASCTCWSYLPQK